MKKNMSKYTEAVKKAKEFWSKVASENGWSMEGRGVTVWQDNYGNITDSLYNPETSSEDISYIVNEESGEVISEINL
jgi:hypothetical protein